MIIKLILRIKFCIVLSATNAYQSTVQVLLPITKCNFEILKLFCCLYCKLSLALVSRMKCIRGNIRGFFCTLLHEI